VALVCAVCSRNDAPAYFRVTRVKNDGTETQVTATCSLVCLAKWVYQASAMQGMRLAMGAQQAVDWFKKIVLGR